MDGREAMGLSGGSAQYYIHRGGVGGSMPGSQAGGGLHTPPGFRHMSNTVLQPQSNVRVSSVGSTFSVEPSRPNFPHHGISMNVTPGVPSGEPVKKKRGRPRKYGPDGPVSLGLSPMSATPNPRPGSTSPTPKRSRGRPPGSGRKQQLATLGDWMNTSAGLAFAPHVITIGAGEDVAAKLLLFSQQRPRALCILSGSGSASSVTLRQPASTGVSVTFEGRFQILCLSGSYLVAEDGGPRNRTGGISVSLSSPDGHVIGGAVAMLIAATPVQVVLCSFVYGGSKTKNKQVAGPNSDENSEPQHNEKLALPSNTPPTQNYNPSGAGIWPGSRQVDLRNPHTGIDLTRG
ncbi:AT-hook motif nuclear-localized protein 5 [Prunus avium]|uniref:AT-hook motif nuclear-localized protein n=1 Tax=Prunus avium TaxID=42229 RepID=A0A6P5SPB4_PRUAV|nr:AT-hook motif nuclear-localized protein 5 [Prunus avium]